MESTMPAAAIRDSISKALFAHAIPGKGIDFEWTANQLVADIGRMGYPRVVIRSDQEPAIVALVDKIKEIRDTQLKETTLDCSPAYDSDANGQAERGVQAAEGITRTMKLELEHRLGARVPASHPLLGWLVRHAADTVTKFEVKTNGRTAYHMLKGRECSGELAAFGQKVLFMLPKRPRGGDMQTRWSEGFWLGKLWRSDEHILAADGGVIRARSIKAMPESASWDAAGLQAITATPWCFKKQDQGEAGQVIFRPVPTGADSEEPPPIGAAGPRAIYIKQKDFDQHGYTDNCRKCQAMLRNDVSQPTLGHTEGCRHG